MYYIYDTRFIRKFFGTIKQKIMEETFDSLNENKRLQIENEFLRMKSMLENGAQFGTMESEKKLSADVENQFLNYIVAFEKQATNPKYIKLYDKIEKPTHFKPVKEISENEIEKAYQELSDYINRYGIKLTVCSPNVSVRELYRFIIEELFEYNMNDMDIPGTVSSFTYDEFYPDSVYDNQRTVETDLFPDIFSEKPIYFDYGFSYSDIILNDEIFPDYNAFKEKINSFKSFYSKISLEEMNTSSTEPNEKESVIKGSYKARLIPKESISEEVVGDYFIIEMVKSDIGYFFIKKMNFIGMNF